ncbi:MAG: hypothetical protein AAF298_23170 [Cyanobacteria bacterium P01_A01_bin.40]
MTNILGTNLNDNLITTDLAEIIKGLFGDDTVDAGGGNGNDSLIGEDDDDTLEG